MAACKSGTPGSLVAPLAPIEVHEADNADPVEVSKLKAEQREKLKGKYGTISAKTTKTEEKKAAGEEKKTVWVELELTDSQGKVLAGEPYEIWLGKDKLTSGTTDEKGHARLENIDPGTVDIVFPRIDKTRWNR